MGGGVRPSQLEYERVFHESFKHWSTYRKAADASSLLPRQCVNFTSLLGHVPAYLACGQLSDHERFSFRFQEREFQGQYGLLTSGHSIWRTSNGDCDTKPKIIPLQLLLAVPEPLKIRFSDNAPLATWSGVKGISESGGVNYITPLFLAWAYILSAKWFELLGHSSSHACKLRCLEGTSSQSALRFDIGYEIDEDEDRWWKAILSFGWKITTTYNGRAYLSPWSVAPLDTPVSGEESQWIDATRMPSCHTALAYVTRFALIKGEDFAKLATLLAYKQPHVAALWLGAIIVGMAKSVIRDIHIGLIALDLHAAAWTSTMESFITINPGKAEGKTILREDECRLLFIVGSDGHTRPPRSPWKPFGKTPLEEAELEIKTHANCNCHCLEYLSWHWESSNGTTLEDSGLNRFCKEKCGIEIEFNDSPEAYPIDQSESLSEIATRGYVF